MILKKGDPFNWIFTSLSWLLGGIYYPIEVLPHWAQKLAQFLPITHALEGMRLAILRGYSLTALLPHIIPLSIITFFLLPVSLHIFRFALKKTKINGSLIQY
jgi:ABC-2 type transport system permease protein